MNIYEAAKEAKRTNGYITREKNKEYTKIKLTQTRNCCMIVDVLNERQPGPRWEPMEEDLLSTDWIVVY